MKDDFVEEYVTDLTEPRTRTSRSTSSSSRSRFVHRHSGTRRRRGPGTTAKRLRLSSPLRGGVGGGGARAVHCRGSTPTLALPARGRGRARKWRPQPSHTSPGRSARNRSGGISACLEAPRRAPAAAASMPSFVSWKVPQWWPSACSAPMSREDPHGVGRVHVLRLHEPARLVGADRQEREPRRRRSARATARKMRAVAVAGVADMVDRAGGRRQHDRRTTAPCGGR